MKREANQRDIDARRIDANGLNFITGEYDRAMASLLVYAPPSDVAEAIIAAYDSTEWRWQDCDGCTGVSECHFPKGVRFPPCVMHDYLCWMARKGLATRAYADNLFFRAMRAYGVSWPRAAWRWAAVRLWGMATANAKGQPSAERR